MNRYRIELTYSSAIPVQKMNVYFAAEGDEQARKFLVYQMSKLIKQEDMELDVYMPLEIDTIIARHKGNDWIEAHLYYVPSKVKCVAKSVTSASMEMLTKQLAGVCHLHKGSIGKNDKRKFQKKRTAWA